MWDLRLVYEHIGTASPAELVSHSLLAKLILLQLVFTFNLEIVFPDKLVQITPAGAQGAIAAGDRVLVQRWHGYTEADGFAMTRSGVSRWNGIWKEEMFMHNEYGVRLRAL